MVLPAEATTKQVKAALKALSGPNRQSLFTACASYLPPKVREKLQS
jgi:hypothetical protein